jgi:hypothetical protein
MTQSSPNNQAIEAKRLRAWRLHYRIRHIGSWTVLAFGVVFLIDGFARNDSFRMGLGGLFIAYGLFMRYTVYRLRSLIKDLESKSQ